MEETLGKFYKDLAGAQLHTKRTSVYLWRTQKARLVELSLALPAILAFLHGSLLLREDGRVIPAQTSSGTPDTNTTRPDSARRRKQGTDGVQRKIQAANGRARSRRHLQRRPYPSVLRVSTQIHDHTKKGARTIWVRSSGKDKERLTSVLLGDSLGRKYPPHLVVKDQAIVRTEHSRGEEKVPPWIWGAALSKDQAAASPAQCGDLRSR
ncbi:hypothetical protein ON010_g12053 [Phytophthora cinnamomi]|nr:hypothetical protein ON010_g12053 [Phytophthora cinnamomi]